MKKQIECPECSSTFTLLYRDEDVEGVPQTCPFCGEPLAADYLDLDKEQDDPIELPEEDE